MTEGLQGVLHFSRRSAEAYMNAVCADGFEERALRQPVHFCMSTQVAEPLRQAGAADIRIASEPTEAAMMALIPAP
jgi:uroporphyrinogen-III synthase